MRSSTAKQFSATGDVAGVAELRHVVLTSGADAASLVLRTGGAGGTVILTVKCPANDTREVTLPNVRVASLHATFTGTGPLATISSS